MSILSRLANPLRKGSRRKPPDLKTPYRAIIDTLADAQVARTATMRTRLLVLAANMAGVYEPKLTEVQLGRIWDRIESLY